MATFDTQEDISSSYEIYLDDESGGRLAAIDDYTSVTYTAVVSGVGELTLTVPGYYKKSLFTRDRRIEVWRRIGQGPLRLEGDTVWFICGIKTVVQDDEKYYEIRAVSSNDILRTRVVAYRGGTSQTEKTDNSDDMMRAVVRENLISPTDTNRAVTGMSTGSDEAKGTSIILEFPNENVLDVLQDIVAQTLQDGLTTPSAIMFFDVVCNGNTAFEFNVYNQFRGTDRRFTGNQGILLAHGHGIGNYTLDEDYSEEYTYAYVGGGGEEDIRPIGTAEDTSRSKRSVIGRREVWGTSQSLVQSTLDSEAKIILTKSRVRRILEAEYTGGPGIVYGRDLYYGDYVTADVDGERFDMRLNAVTITHQNNGDDDIQVVMRSDT